MKGIWIAGLAAFCLFGTIVYGASQSWFGISLKAEIRPLEAATLAINLFIAFFLQRFFTTRISDIRAEKNVLIGSVSEIIRLLDETRELTDRQFGKASIDAPESQAIVLSFRRASNAITDLQECILLSQLKSSANEIPPIRSELFELKGICTGAHYPSAGYTIKQRNSQERLFRSLAAKCRSLIFSINRATS